MAYVVSRSVGIDCQTRSSDYIQLWNGDEETLTRSLEMIRSVSNLIVGELEQWHAKEVHHVA